MGENEMITFDVFKEKAEKDISKGIALISMTDTYQVADWPMDDTSCINQAKLLEIRVFDKDSEYRLFRSCMGENFHLRVRSDKTEDIIKYFDDVYYLDIDEVASLGLENAMVQTTGGGRYYLPLQNHGDAGIRIRYYLAQNASTGVSEVVDSRVVEFVEVK